MSVWGTEGEIERKNRIRLSLAAYAYELEDNPIMSDESFDKLAGSILPQLLTGNDKLDKFFQTEFSPDTGQWIHKHPELDKVKVLYDKLFKT